MKARSKRPFRKFLKAFWGGRRADAEGLLTSPTLASFFVPLPLHWSDDDRPDDQPEATWGTCKEIMWAEGIVVDDETFTISFTFLSANAAPIKVYDGIVAAGWEMEASYHSWACLGDYAKGRDNRIPESHMTTLQEKCFREHGPAVLWAYSRDNDIDLQALSALDEIEAMAESSEWPHREIDTLMTDKFFRAHSSLFRVTQRCPEHHPGSEIRSGGCRCMSFGWPGGWGRLARECRMKIIRLKLCLVDGLALPQEMRQLLKDAYMERVG